MKVLILFYKNYKRKQIPVQTMCFKIAFCSIQAVVNLGVKYWFANSITLYPNEFSLFVSLPHTQVPKLPYLMFDVTGMLECWVTLTIPALFILFQIPLSSVLSPPCSLASLPEATGGVLRLTSCTGIILVN